jgi:pyruvate-ferredoxin/flavodoxin oxidoreductase
LDVFGRKDINVTSSIYGLSSKEFTPAMVKSVLDNSKKGKLALKFNVVGIQDDLNKMSLELG